MHAFITTVYNIWNRPDTVDLNLIKLWPLFWYDVSIEVLHVNVWICQSWVFFKTPQFGQCTAFASVSFFDKTLIMSFVTFSVFAKTSPLNKKSLIIGCLRQVSKKTLTQAKKSCFLTTLHNLHFQHQIWVLNRTSIIQILSEEYSKLCNCYILKRDNMMIPHRNWNCHVSDTI